MTTLNATQMEKLARIVRLVSDRITKVRDGMVVLEDSAIKAREDLRFHVNRFAAMDPQSWSHADVEAMEKSASNLRWATLRIPAAHIKLTNLKADLQEATNNLTQYTTSLISIPAMDEQASAKDPNQVEMFNIEAPAKSKRVAGKNLAK